MRDQFSWKALGLSSFGFFDCGKLQVHRDIATFRRGLYVSHGQRDILVSA
jgi:hypothetical protein